LFFLDLLQSKEFCKELSKTNVIEFIHTQQFRCAYINTQALRLAGMLT
jgi:hypothetical protein